MNIWNLIVAVASVAAPIVLAISYVPQIRTLTKSKNAEGISLQFWYILDLSLVMLLILAIDSGAIGSIIAQAMNLVLAVIVTLLVILYKKGK